MKEKWRLIVEEREERFFSSYEEAAAAFKAAVLAGAKRARLERIPPRWERIFWTLRRILWTPLTLLCTIRLRYYMWKYRGCEEVPLTLPC